MSLNQELETDSNIEDKNPQKIIKLKVIGDDNNEIYFRVKMTTPMLKIKNSYSERVGVPAIFLRFIYDGNRINDIDSPISLEMSNDDIIEVYVKQTGG